jgi:hypothetical protein
MKGYKVDKNDKIEQTNGKGYKISKLKKLLRLINFG